MYRLHAGLGSTLTLAATLVASPVCAQTVASSFDELRGLVKTAELLTVLDETGARTTGRLFELSGSLLVLVTKEKKRDGAGVEREEWTGRRSFSDTAVAEITRTDSLRNGTLIGLGAGSAVLAITLATLVNGAGFECGFPVLCLAMLASPAIGAAVGAGVDASQGRTTIYRASSPGGRQTLAVSPLVGLRSVGVSVAARF